MCKKTLCLLILMAGFVASVGASTVKWLISPKYDAIYYFSETLFKCKIDGKTQLVDLKGQTLLPRAADSITDLSEGIALVLEKTNNHYKVVGFVKEANHSYLSINGNYYAGMYSFFSEGLISVADANTDLFGYLNDKGEMLPQEALHFNYLKARPFIKGWASVEPANKNQTTIYINKQGKNMNLNGFHRGKVVLGSSFNASGEASAFAILLLMKAGKNVMQSPFLRSLKKCPVSLKTAFLDMWKKKKRWFLRSLPMRDPFLPMDVPSLPLIINMVCFLSLKESSKLRCTLTRKSKTTKAMFSDFIFPRK